MKIIKINEIATCANCASRKKLVSCQVKEKGLEFFKDLFCPECINEFEEDKENYTVID